MHVVDLKTKEICLHSREIKRKKGGNCKKSICFFKKHKGKEIYNLTKKLSPNTQGTPACPNRQNTQAFYVCFCELLTLALAVEGEGWGVSRNARIQVKKVKSQWLEDAWACSLCVQRLQDCEHFQCSCGVMGRGTQVVELYQLWIQVPSQVWDMKVTWDGC